LLGVEQRCDEEVKSVGIRLFGTWSVAVGCTWRWKCNSSLSSDIRGSNAEFFQEKDGMRISSNIPAKKCKKPEN
jgi:hypothetical protein